MTIPVPVVPQLNTCVEPDEEVMNDGRHNRNQLYLSDWVKVAGLLEVAPADIITDGTKKGKGLSEPQTLYDFAHFFENDC